jgi:RNA polymerase-binding transcription factor DksA
MITNEQPRGNRRVLRDQLDARRRQLAGELQLRVERIRANGRTTMPPKEDEEGDSCELDVVYAEIATATVRRIDQAIKRLDEGTYGVCTRCRGPIGESRLRALPFAVCCQRCEAAREQEAAEGQRERRRAWTLGRALNEPFARSEH